MYGATLGRWPGRDPWTAPRYRDRSLPDNVQSWHDPQPLTPPVRAGVDWHLCPHHRQLGGDPVRAGPLQERDELLKQPLVCLELVAEPATDPQIVLEDLAQVSHAAPATATATAARAPAALCGQPCVDRCRLALAVSQHLPISASDAPARSIPVAAVCLSRCGPTGGIPARTHASCTTPQTTAPADRTRGREHLQEQRPRARSLDDGASTRPAPRQIARQWQHVIPAALAMDQHLAAAPVDVLERDRGDLAARNPSRASSNKIA